MVLHKSKGKGKGKGMKQTIPCTNDTDEDSVDIFVLLANTPAKVKSQFHRLEKALGGLGSYVNIDNTEDMFFN